MISTGNKILSNIQEIHVISVMIFTHFSINLAMSIKMQPINIFQLRWLLKLKKYMYIIFVCFTSKTLKWLLLLFYTHPHPSFLGNFLHLGTYVCIQCIRKNTNQHLHVIFFQITCRTQPTGVEGHFLRPISQELCFKYLPMHIQYPSSKIRSMQIFIISPLKTITKFRFIWPSGFRGEYSNVKS